MIKPDATASLPPDPQSQSFSTYLSARFAAQQHDMPDAARYYGQSLKTDPNNADLLSLAFFFSTTSGDFDAAANYAQKVVATTPEDRSARLALAVVAFKHKDYAEARKQLAASGTGPLTVFVVSLFDAWAAAAQNDSATVAADLKSLGALSGTEAVVSFHAALIAEFMNQDADALYAKALMLNPGSPRVVEAFGRYLERRGLTADATKFYNTLSTSTALAPLADAGLARVAKGEKPDPMVHSAEEGAAEGLLNIASTITDASDADVSILYLRMVLYLRPDMGLIAQRSCWPTAALRALQEYEEADAIYGKVSTRTRPITAWRQCRRRAMKPRRPGITMMPRSRKLKTLTQVMPKDSEAWLALGDAYRETNKFDDAVTAYTQAETSLGKPAKKDWTLFYARAMAEDKAGHWDKAEADVNTRR